MLCGLRQRAQIGCGHTQVLDDAADVVLIIADQSIRALHGQIEVLRDSVDFSALRDLAEASGDDNCITDGLPEGGIREQGVDPRRGRGEVAYRLVDRCLSDYSVDVVDGRARVAEDTSGIR